MKTSPKRTNSKLPTSSGYLIVKRGYNGSLHLAPQGIVGLEDNGYKERTTIIISTDKDHDIQLSMPLDCVKYFIALAERGMTIDLTDYSGYIGKNKIKKDSPEYNRFRLPIAALKPEDIFNSAAQIGHTAIAEKPQHSEPAKIETLPIAERTANEAGDSPAAIAYRTRLWAAEQKRFQKFRR